MTFFPVIVKSCVWEEIPWLSRFQARPQDGRALAGFRGNRLDSELTKIAKEILAIVRNGAHTSSTFAQPDLPKLTVLAPLHQLPTPPADFTGREEDLDFLRSKSGRRRHRGHLRPARNGRRRQDDPGAETRRRAEAPLPRRPDLPGPQGCGPSTSDLSPSDGPCDPGLSPRGPPPGERSRVGGAVSIRARREACPSAHGQRGEERAGRAADSAINLPAPGDLSIPFCSSWAGRQGSGRDARGGRQRLYSLRIAPRIGDAADEIARLCGRLPLALRLAGSALAERPNLSPSEYARRFKEGKETLEPVEASLKTSYDLLTEEQRRLWRLLAVFPETFDAKAAAAVWELDMMNRETSGRVGEEQPG